ncbi:MAG: N-formylglutamate amidohydrolase [Pseudomonadota bacterium]
MHPDFPEGSSPAFTVHAPAQQRVPFVFNSPHSGRAYPLAFRAASRLTAAQLRRSEDVAVDILFSAAVGLGAPLLTANFPRAWLDVNREPLELDPKLIADPLPAHANSRSARVGGGLGTVPRLVAERVEIYAGRMTLGEAMARINGVYRPYHEQLARLIARTVRTFGYSVLVDCHSMPSKGPGGDADGVMRDDIIIGDRYGTSCNSAITQELVERFSDAGYRVARNKPYAGGFITEHYGRPSRGFHAVQIEVNRGLYLNEVALEPNGNFETVRADIRRIMGHLVSIPDHGFAPHAMAAE